MEKYKKPAMIIGGIAAGLLIIYLIGVLYFSNHFFAGTKINGIDFSMKSAEQTEKYFKDQMKNYKLEIISRDGAKETLEGSKFAMEYTSKGEAEKLLKKQTSAKWPAMFLKKQDLTMEQSISYDEEKLQAAVQALTCMSDEGKVSSENAAPEFDGSVYVVKPEVYGTLGDKTIMAEAVIEAVKGAESKLELDKTGCYHDPTVKQDDPSLAKLVEDLNSYLGASITYDMISHEEVVDSTLISQWLTYDESYQVTFDEEKVEEYMSGFGDKYDTIGTTRNFTTASGNAATVSGGTYGWEIDEAAETEALIASIKAGEVVTREPQYVQRAATHAEQDWGTTYIEVDLSSQYMWCIVDGAVALETAVVTGKPYDHTTPDGVYTILSMGRNVTLVGNIVPETGQPEYRTPVAYWMQVTSGGVGFHDATWQPTFGGNWYLDHGSHGCINMPSDAAGTLYSLISNGTPVIIHY